MANYGFLVPTGGGEDIPLKKDRILIGRRDNCDIVLRFANVSGQHCRLTLEQGYWFIKDLDSRNGTKVRFQFLGVVLFSPKLFPHFRPTF